MKDLIERLEKATGPSGAIDVAIWEAIYADPKKHRRTPPGRPRYSDWESCHNGEWFPFYPSLNAKSYTFSIDAALTLVPEPWRADLWQCDDGIYWHAGARVPGLEVGTDERCVTPAMALCVAALKARTLREATGASAPDIHERGSNG